MTDMIKKTLYWWVSDYNDYRWSGTYLPPSHLQSSWWLKIKSTWQECYNTQSCTSNNKAKLRDSIAPTGQWSHSNWIQVIDFSANVTLKFDGWPLKIIGHLFLTTSSFVHHLKSIGKFQLRLQSGNAQFGSNWAIFCPGWTWNLTDDLEKD